MLNTQHAKLAFSYTIWLGQELHSNATAEQVQEALAAGQLHSFTSRGRVFTAQQWVVAYLIDRWIGRRLTVSRGLASSQIASCIDTTGDSGMSSTS